MRYFIPVFLIVSLVLSVSFREKKPSKSIFNEVITTNVVTTNSGEQNNKNVQTANQATEFVEYARTFIGTPYLYGSVDPGKGLDCSGFINAVSSHFGIKVPRSSAEFTNLGADVETINAKPGDLILFTGTDPAKHVVGHIGIITNNENGDVQFIHSSSGKANGVTISELDGYYETRLVKVIRIFPTDTDKTIG